MFVSWVEGDRKARGLSAFGFNCGDEGRKAVARDAQSPQVAVADFAERSYSGSTGTLDDQCLDASRGLRRECPKA
jgi:hypothetical protein